MAARNRSESVKANADKEKFVLLGYGLGGVLAAAAVIGGGIYGGYLLAKHTSKGIR